MAAGRLEMSAGPAMAYYLLANADVLDAASFREADGLRMRMLFVSGATPEDTGVPSWGREGEAWLMWPGSPTARIVFPPAPRAGTEGGAGREGPGGTEGGAEGGTQDGTQDPP